MNRFFGHLATVVRHRHKVFVHCCRAGIPVQGMLHDLSKFSPSEFLPSVRYWQGNRSPNEREREVKGYSGAWMHHKGRNKHHYEYWTDYNPDRRRLEPVRMPRKYVAEMFCDRVAASKIYKGKDYRDSDPLDYFRRSRARIFIHPATAYELGRLLEMLAEKGEKETFAFVRKYRRGEALKEEEIPVFPADRIPHLDSEYTFR